MKKKPNLTVTLRLISCFLLLFLTGPLFAGDLLLEFLDGTLEIKESSEWMEAAIGDSIPENATVRLGDSSYAELSPENGPGHGRITITLSQPGTYHLAELLDTSSRLADLGIGSRLTMQLQSRLATRPEKGTTIMGVRGEVQDADIRIGDEGKELLQAGIDLMYESRYEEALSVFEEAIDLVNEEQEGLVSFYTANTYALMDRPMRALQVLERASPKPRSPVYNEHILLQGKLLIESFAYLKALDWLDTYHVRSADPTTLQMVYLLKALAYSGLRNEDSMKQALRAVLEMDPRSETARLAEDLLKSR